MPSCFFLCHLKRNKVESRDLRTFGSFQVKSVRRSLDSLRSRGMTFFGSQQKEGTRPSSTNTLAIIVIFWYDTKEYVYGGI